MVRVQRPEPREEPEPGRLRHERERPRDQCLRGDDRRDRRQQDHRVQQSVRHEAVEELAARDRRVAEQVGALAEVVEQQRRIHDREPADSYRPRAEVAEVRVHRLATRHDQHQCAQDQQRVVAARAPQELETVEWIEGGHDPGVVSDLHGAEDRDHDEPGDQDWAEHPADPGGTPDLHGKERGQQRNRDRDDEAPEGWRGDSKPLDGREYADRRRDDPVAE